MRNYIIITSERDSFWAFPWIPTFSGMTLLCFYSESNSLKEENVHDTRVGTRLAIMKSTNMRASSNKIGLSDQLLSYIAAFALFIVLPSIVAGLLGANAINIEQKRQLSETKKQLETNLNQFVCDFDKNTFLLRVAKGTWFSLKDQTARQPIISSYIDSLQRFLKVDFDLYIFDKEGKLKTPKSARLRSRYLGIKLWEMVRAPFNRQSTLYKKIRKPVKSFLGGEFKVAQFLDRKNSLLPIIVRHQAGRVFWQQSKRDKKSGMIMIFWNLPSPELRINETVKRNSYNFTEGIAWWNEKHIIDFGEKKTGFNYASLVHSRLALQQKPLIQLNDRIWLGRKIKDCWIFVSENFDTERFRLMHIILMSVLILLVIGAIIVSLMLLNKPEFKISIRYKLLVLFFTAIIIPVMAFLFLGYQYIADREATMIAEVANKSRTELFALDESFSNIGKTYESEWKKLLPFFANESEESVREKMDRKLESNELVTLEVRSSDAKIDYTIINELFFEGMRDISEAFSRFCIDNMLGTNFSKSVDPILSMIIKAPEGGMFFLFDRPGEIHPMHFGPAPLLILWDIIENKVNEKVYIFVLQSASVLLKKLVKTKMQQLHASTKKSNYTIVARNNISGQWFPATPVQTSELKKFSQRLQFSNKPDDFQIQINDKNYLLTGQNGKYAQNYSFFCFYPKQIIENKLTTIRKLIYLGLIVFLIVTLLAGNILSNTFLTPISRLGQGVEAIKNRNGEFRIETEQKDEFGDLSSSFNHMIEDLKEMQLAKDVQESLLPSDFPKVDRYDIEYVNRMATDVGGDYFDLQRLEDNRIIIIIGDVTGHGVSSALVMAMAKAIVYQGLKEKKSLNELFSDLNLAIHTYFQIPPARKMITLFAAVLDQSDNSLTCVNAGHNFPMKLMANGKIEDFSAVHLPIGAQKKLRNLKTCKYQLQRGDMIVFYTDGIIEVKNSQKQMYGYDKFKANLVKMTDLTAQEAINQMVETYDNFLEGNEPDDDITVILVKRIE